MLENALLTLVRAFQEDPLMTLVEPDDARRPRVLRTLFRGALVHCRRHGGVQVQGDGAEVAVAWSDARRARLRVSDLLVTGLWTAPVEIGAGAVRRLGRLEAWALARLTELADHGDTYIWMVGALPSARGRGLGRRAIEHALADMPEGRRCWLKTENETNVGLYEHLGFTVVDEGRDPATRLHTWLLARSIPNVGGCGVAA